MDWRPLGLALAVLLTGCGALGGAGVSQGSGAGTPTLTPAPVPEVTATPMTLPPGVTGRNVTDANALVDAHMAAIEGRSYTLRVRVQVDDDVSRRLFRVETPTRYYRADRLAEPWGDSIRFADGETLYVRNNYSGAVEFGRFDEPTLLRSQTIMLSRAFLSVDRVRVAETRIDGEVAYELAGQYPVHPAVGTLYHFSLRAVVEPDGFIRSLNVSYFRRSGSVGSNVTRSFAYTDVDATTVERPDWVAERWNATGSEARTETGE